MRLDAEVEALRLVAQRLAARIAEVRATQPSVGSRGAVLKELHRLRSFVNEEIDSRRCRLHRRDDGGHQ